MKTWTELQEWVELHAAPHAKVTSINANQAARSALIESVGSTLAGPEFEQFNETEIELLKSALLWKSMEEVASYFTQSAEGWAESYIADLHRMYQEES